MTIIVNPSTNPRVITVPAADGTTITIQSLHDQIRTWEEQPDSMSYPTLLKSSGKETLGGGLQVGITATMQNTKLAFEARGGPSFVQCTITGGNLVAIDGNGDNIDPIQTTAFTQVVLTNAVSAAIITEWSAADITQLLADAARTRLIAEGRWHIVNDQLIYYDTDGTTAIRTFNLFDSAGVPTSTSPFDRNPV